MKHHAHQPALPPYPPTPQPYAPQPPTPPTAWHPQAYGQPYIQPLGQQQVTYRKMGWIAGTFHFCMMVATLGLWTPVYLFARRGRRTVTRYQ